MDGGHGQDAVMEAAIHDLLHDLETGHGQSWTEGVRYNAQCDGKNHYLYKIDKSAVNSKTGKGYSKGRIYVGTFNANKHKCEAYAASWESRHTCGAGRSGDGHGRFESASIGGSENDLSEDHGKPYKWQDFVIPDD